MRKVGRENRRIGERGFLCGGEGEALKGAKSDAFYWLNVGLCLAWPMWDAIRCIMLHLSVQLLCGLLTAAHVDYLFSWKGCIR